MMRRLRTREDIHRAEQLIGLVLIVGVVASACVVLVGGIYYLVQYGASPADYNAFHGVPKALKSLPRTFAVLSSGSSHAIIQAGLFVLVLLQSVRLAFCAWMFGRQLDWLYVLMNFFLIGVLLHTFV